MLLRDQVPNPSVVLSHAGVQYSYRVASALEEADILRCFYTTIYNFQNEKVTFPFVKARRRFCEGLNEQLIASDPWPEILERLATGLLGKNRFTKNPLLYWRNCWFDSRVARRLNSSSWDCFIGYAGSCLASFRRAKALGRSVVLDQHDVHPAFAERLLKEEIDLHPDFAPLIPFWPPHRGYLERVNQELELADYILVLSQFALDSHRQNGIPKEKLVWMPLGVDLCGDPIKEEVEKHPFQVLFLGTIGQRKGIKYLLEAVKQLHMCNLKLILAGQIDGNPKPLVPYRDFFHHVGFLSAQALRDCWASTRVLVLPSVYDSLGQVILEAMAHGVPVIVSENTAGHDIVREGVDGFVVPIRDVEALKDRILRLYQDEELWQYMHRNAVERAKEFTWIKYRERLVAFLKGLTHEK
ncbi:MAG: glycosyltransferase family 4 protein [Candidatus Omnitrophica bacterium]|nr:glycosyltransferase family 4 protein [Candidatus Omnitrophota bacterium]